MGDTLEDGLRDMRLIMAGMGLCAVMHADSLAGVVAACVGYPLVYLGMATLARMLAKRDPAGRR